MSLLAARLASQGLAGKPARDPVAVAERLLAVQAQDPRGARLAVRARSAGLTAADVDHALTVDRSLVITWLNRGTLHLVRSEDLAWLHALTTPQLAATSARRLAQERVAPDAADRGVRVIAEALAADGALTRAELRERLDRAGIRTRGQALVHVLLLATLRGLIVRGPVAGGEQAYVLVRDWLGEPPPVDRVAALRELARRYLAGHAPASDRDLARWAGITLRDARAGLGGIASELVQRTDGLVDLAARAAAPHLPPPQLLGSFEPVLLGWRSRDWLPGAHGTVLAANGVFRPFALAGGRAVATWSHTYGSVALAPFAELDGVTAAALEADAADVTRFFGAAGA